MIRAIKAWLKSDAGQRRAAGLIAGYIRLVHRTGRWTHLGEEHVRPYWDSGEPFIAAFWHGRLMMMPPAWRSDRPVSMLISRHRDGELITRAIAHFGIGAIRGSTAKGGQAKGGLPAVRDILRRLRQGHSIAVTPDGPRGPACQVGGAIIDLARLSGAPIIPASFGARWGKRLGSWDRFLVALPFTRGAITVGAPIRVPRDADPATLERCRLTLETELNRLAAEADSHARA